MRKFFMLLVAVMLVAGLLAGCGGSKTDSQGSGSGTTSSSGSGSGSSSGSGSGSAAPSADPIKIGMNLELSGGVASYGQSIAEGVELALEQINGAGGVDGRKIDLVKADNKSEAPEAANNARKLIDQDKVVAIIGAATSGSTLAQIDITGESKVVLLTPSGTNTMVTVNEAGQLNEYAFRTCFIDPFQGEVAGNFAWNDLGVKNAAIYVDNAADYSIGLADSFKKTFTANGGKIVAEEAFVAGDTDFRSTLTRIKAANPDFVYVPAYYEEVGLILNQARELGLNVAFMGGDGWDSPTLVDLAGKDALNNTFVTNAYSPEDTDPAVQKFVADFKAKYGKDPDAFSALGYDSLYFLADALKRSGGEGQDKLKAAMESTDGLELVTGKLKLNANHDPIKGAAVLEYKDGVAKFKTKVNP